MPAPAPPYTPIVRAGDWLIVSGQIGLVDGELVPGGVQAELAPGDRQPDGAARGRRARRCADVRKTTVFLRHMRDYSARERGLRRGRSPSPTRPGRRSRCSELPFVALVEIEAWAYTGG